MDIPKDVIACGPDDRVSHLPPEDVAVLQAFADWLTDWPATDLVPCDVLPEWHPAGECPTPYHCPGEGEK
jgi:hypothetical protein